MKETVLKKINEVESVSLLYPEFMSPDAADNIKKLQEHIWAIGEEIQSHRKAIYELEKVLDKDKDMLSKLLNIASIKYKMVSKEITINTSTFGVRGHGNDIIGRTSKV